MAAAVCLCERGVLPPLALKHRFNLSAFLQWHSSNLCLLSSPSTPHSVQL